MKAKLLAALVATVLATFSCGGPPAPPMTPATTPEDPARWRAEKKLVDMHVHVDRAAERYDRALAILDAAGVGVAVNLSGGKVTPAREEGGRSTLEISLELGKHHPGRSSST